MTLPIPLRKRVKLREGTNQLAVESTDVGGNAVFASDGTQITIFGVTEADLSNDDFLV